MLNTLMATLGFVVGIMGPVILMSQATKNLDRSAPQLYYPVSSIGRVIASQTLQFSIVIIILDLFFTIIIIAITFITFTIIIIEIDINIPLLVEYVSIRS